MSDTLIELKPCPFCGGAGELHPSALSAFTRMAFVECVDCGCRSMASHYDNPGFMPQHIVKAAENWNNRLDEKELAEARAEIERLREYTTCTLESTDAEMDDKDIQIIKKDKLIEQMRDALSWQCAGCPDTNDYGDKRHCDECSIKQLLSAAERINK